MENIHSQARQEREDPEIEVWKSASLYIGDLGVDVIESDLSEIFSKYGPLKSVKVCRNWETGQHLGYGFLNFERERDAEAALAEYNFKNVKGQPCRLMWSTKRSSVSLKEDHAANVFVKGLPKVVDSKYLHNMFSGHGSILSCRVAKGRRGGSLGYGYVSFASFASAQKAISQLDGTDVFGQRITVEMFVEKQNRAEKPWSNIHVAGIPETWTQEDLKKRFSVFGEIRSVVIMVDSQGVSRGFGFVDFVHHHSAAQAVTEYALVQQKFFSSPDKLLLSPNGKALKESVQDTQEPPVFLKITPAFKKTEKGGSRTPRAGSVSSRRASLFLPGSVGSSQHSHSSSVDKTGGEFYMQRELLPSTHLNAFGEYRRQSMWESSPVGAQFGRLRSHHTGLSYTNQAPVGPAYAYQRNSFAMDGLRSSLPGSLWDAPLDHAVGRDKLSLDEDLFDLRKDSSGDDFLGSKFDRFGLDFLHE